MTYSKPEITVLGDANVLVQGNKSGSSDSPPTSGRPPAFELDD